MEPDKLIEEKQSEETTNEVSFDLSRQACLRVKGIDPLQDITEEKKVLQLSKNQLKKLGLVYKKEPTQKEKERNERLRQMQLERHAKFKKDKEDFEKKQLEELSQKIAIKDKPKQKYVKKPPPPPEPSSESEDEDYKEFLKFKQAKAKVVKVKPSKEESDDERIQKKKAKAKEIIDTVQKIDKTINQIYKNPYLDLFNKPK